MTCPVFKVNNGGVLRLESVTMKKEDNSAALKQCVIDASSGKLVLLSSTFTGISLTDTEANEGVDADESEPLILIGNNADSVTFGYRHPNIESPVKTSFSSITRNAGNGAVFEITMGTNDMELTKCTFTSCGVTGTGACGGAISVTYGTGATGTLTVSGVTFTSCTSEKSNGGAINVKYEAAGELVIKDTIFTSCTAVKGHGGAIYVECTANGEMSVENTTFKSCGVETGVATGTYGSGVGGAICVYVGGSTPSLTWSNVEFGSEGTEACTGTTGVFVGMISTTTTVGTPGTYFMNIISEVPAEN